MDNALQNLETHPVFRIKEAGAILPKGLIVESNGRIAVFDDDGKPCTGICLWVPRSVADEAEMVSVSPAELEPLNDRAQRMLDVLR